MNKRSIYALFSNPELGLIYPAHHRLFISCILTLNLPSAGFINVKPNFPNQLEYLVQAQFQCRLCPGAPEQRAKVNPRPSWAKEPMYLLERADDVERGVYEELRDDVVI